MNNLTKSIRIASSKLFQRNSLKSFASNKKNTKPSAGSDIEVDKSKKSLKNQEKDENPQQKYEKTEKQPEKTESSSQIPHQQHQKQQHKENIKEVHSVPGNKPPTSEDSVSGRYAQTLFIAASISKELHKVNEDMLFIKDIYTTSELFRTFSANSGLNANQINHVMSEIGKSADFTNSTIAFIDLLGQNKRFMFIKEIAEKYIKNYNLLSKEEKIKIVSAHELSQSQREQVKNALQENPQNKGKSFVIDYETNSDILGGIQLYSENKFMDLSLKSRIEKLKEEVNRLV
jgi:F-type H+-transporting ATPase subunit delta